MPGRGRVLSHMGSSEQPLRVPCNHSPGTLREPGPKREGTRQARPLGGSEVRLTRSLTFRSVQSVAFTRSQRRCNQPLRGVQGVGSRALSGHSRPSHSPIKREAASVPVASPRWASHRDRSQGTGRGAPGFPHCAHRPQGSCALSGCLSVPPSLLRPNDPRAPRDRILTLVCFSPLGLGLLPPFGRCE